jgi:hypothetical protein
VKDDEISRASSMHGEKMNSYTFWSETQKEKDHFGDQVVSKWIILELTLYR